MAHGPKRRHGVTFRPPPGHDHRLRHVRVAHSSVMDSLTQPRRACPAEPRSQIVTPVGEQANMHTWCQGWAVRSERKGGGSGSRDGDQFWWRSGK